MCHLCIFYSYIEIIEKWIKRSLPYANPKWNITEIYESLKMNTMYTCRNVAPIFVDLPSK